MNANANTVVRDTEVEELLTAVFTLCLLNASMNAAELEKKISNARMLASRRVRRLRPQEFKGVDFDVLGHVVYRWQRSAKYLNDDGVPLAIPARGPAPSIQALFREVKKGHYFEEGLKHLIQVARILHTMLRGNYCEWPYTGAHTTIGSNHKEACIYGPAKHF
jgi:hypothetical protein